MVKTASEIWRDYATDGVSGSGAHQPIRSDIREHMQSLAGAAQSFTPVLTFETPGDFSPTYTTQKGRYWLTPGGDRLDFSLYINANLNAFTTAAGNARISGMPVVAASVSGYYYNPLNIGLFRNIAVDQVGDIPRAYIENGDSHIELRWDRNHDTNNFGGNLDVANFTPSQANVAIAISGFYIVAP